MKKIDLIKAAIDFAFANYKSDAITFAESSIAAFKAAGGQASDLGIWTHPSGSTAAWLLRYQVSHCQASRLPRWLQSNPTPHLQLPAPLSSPKPSKP
jgi:hypothetical protein